MCISNVKFTKSAEAGILIMFEPNKLSEKRSYALSMYLHGVQALISIRIVLLGYCNVKISR